MAISVSEVEQFFAIHRAEGMDAFLDGLGDRATERVGAPVHRDLIEAHGHARGPVRSRRRLDGGHHAAY